MITRRFLIAALAALILSLGAVAFAGIRCPNPDCPYAEDCPGAISGDCPYDGQGPQNGQGQGPGPGQGAGPTKIAPKIVPKIARTKVAVDRSTAAATAPARSRPSREQGRSNRISESSGYRASASTARLD